jgi:WD40 repeat protein
MTQTQFERIEGHLPELLSELGAARVPDYFDDLLQQTGRARQRPAWSSLERWLPMGVVARPALAGLPAWRPILIGALVIIAVVAGALIYAGSRPTPLPPPFGPAGNGNLYFANADGDIVAMDPTTLTQTPVVTGGHHDAWPLPSKDGRFIQFQRNGTVMVANSDGSNVHQLKGEYLQITEEDWSPDSTAISIVSTIKGRSAITILQADGSGARTLEPKGLQVHYASFLPDGRILFLGIGKVAFSDTFAIYVMNADGTEVRPLVPPSRLDTDYIAPWPSPDGKSVLYHVWRDPDELGRLYITDIATGSTHPIDISAGTGENLEAAQYSPDGTLALFSRFNACCRTLSVAPVAGGPPRDIGERVPGNSGQVASALFSPDGKFVIAWYPDSGKLWLLDPSGARPDRQIPVSVPDVPAWQRVAAP